MEETIMQRLKEYFEKEQSVLLAFLFGSASTGRETEESDVDVGIWLVDSSREQQIWSDISSLLEKEVDLVVLNEAPATLVSNILKTGTPLVVKDSNLYRRLHLEKTTEAEDFAEFAESYWRIAQRARSLSPEDRTRLLERLRFLENELSEIERFRQLTFQEYQEERPKRREIERWTENIMNAIIDIAKIALASEKRDMPKTYEAALRDFALLAGLDEEKAQKFSQFAKLRNILAHEYLDILYGRIRNFIDEFPPLYKEVSSFLEKYLEPSRL